MKENKLLILLLIFFLTQGCEKEIAEPNDNNAPVIESDATYLTNIPLNTSIEIITTAYDDIELESVEIKWWLQDTNNNNLESYTHDMTPIGGNLYSYTIPGYNVQRNIIYQLIAADTADNWAIIPPLGYPFFGYFTIHIR